MAINLATVKLKHTAIYALAILLIYGCAAGPATQEVEALNKRLARVEKSLDESDARVEELESKFTLLREKLNAGESDGAALEAEDITPPEGLKVIRLGAGTLTIKELTGKDKGPAIKAAGPAVKDKAALEKGPRPVMDMAHGRGRGKGLSSEPPEAIYKRGQDLYLAGRYGEARGVFTELSNLYPKSSLADNAFFWSGEAFYAEKNYPKALGQFNVVVERYPRGNKVPDSLLMMGLCYVKTGESEKAVPLLKRLVDKYPRSEAARIASKRLKSL